MKFIETIINDQEYAPKCFIHTIEIFIPKTEVERWEEEYKCSIKSLKSSKPYINFVSPSNDDIKIAINPNRAYNSTKTEEYDNIIDFTQYKQAIDYIINDIGIILWHYNRIDIAFDIPIITDDTFIKLYNINYLLISCICNYKNKDYNFFTASNGENNTINSLTIKNRSNMHFEIYDKNLESNGKFKSVRIEFRFKSLNNRRNKEKNNNDIEIDCINNAKEILKEIKKQERYNLTLEHYKQVILEYASNVDLNSKPKVQQREFVSKNNNLFIKKDIFAYFYNDVLSLDLTDEQIKQKKKHINQDKPYFENVSYNLYQKYCRLFEKSIDKYFKKM